MNIVEAWKGYFRAPYTGNYKFYVSSDDNSEVWLSNTSNSTSDSNLNKIAYVSSYSTYEKPYYIDSQRSAYIHLDAGGYYLMNVFRNQYTGSSHLSVAVEVPYTSRTPLKTSSMQKIEIDYHPIREIQYLTLNQYKAINQFKIVLIKRDDLTGKTILDQETQPMFYNISANDLCSRVSYDLGWGWPIVTKYPIDINGNLINDSHLLNPTTGSLFIINFTIYRPPFQNQQIQPSISLVNLDDYYTQVTITQMVAPSPPITGNLTLLSNNASFTIPGNSADISAILKQAFPALSRYFLCEFYGNIYDNHYYLVKFDGVNVSSLVTVFSNDQPTVNITEIIPGSNNLYLSPIPNEYLFTPSKNL